MFQENQVVKITANTPHAYLPAQFTATIYHVSEILVDIEISEEDWAKVDEAYKTARKGRRTMGIITKSLTGGKLDWSVEVITSTETYEVKLPDTGWARENEFTTTKTIETEIESGDIVAVGVIDDIRRDDYIIREAMLLDKNHQIIRYLDWQSIKLIDHRSDSEVNTTFSYFYGVISAAETAERYNLAEATVRQYINRNKPFWARRSGGTWILLVCEADKIWGKTSPMKESL